MTGASPADDAHEAHDAHDAHDAHAPKMDGLVVPGGGPHPVADERSGGGAEARLDLLLAEELAVDRGFAAWFVRVAGRSSSPLGVPDGEPAEVEVRLNHVEAAPPIPLDAYGETDVDVTMRWGDGRSLAVLVEDKVWAPFQPRQPERYIARAEARRGAAVLVAPARYIDGHRAEADTFHGVVAIEEIVAWLRGRAVVEAADPASARRRTWRADLLDELIAPRTRVVVDDEPTVAFTQFCVDWLARRGSVATPNPRTLHSAGQGWLWFASPVGLVYKACGWARQDLAAADLYVADHGFTGTAGELAVLLADVGLPEGFRCDVDTAKPPNVVLRFDCAKVMPSEGVPVPGSTREAAVVEVLEACHRAALWLQEHRTRLQGDER